MLQKEVVEDIEVDKLCHNFLFKDQLVLGVEMTLRVGILKWVLKKHPMMNIML
jgi:hypothetical protein